MLVWPTSPNLVLKTKNLLNFVMTSGVILVGLIETRLLLIKGQKVLFIVGDPFRVHIPSSYRVVAKT